MLGKIIGGGALRQASFGECFSLKTFRKMISTLEGYIKKDKSATPRSNPKYGFFSRLTLAQRQEKYENSKNVIRAYMKEFIMEYSRNWNQEYVEAFHVIKLLKRNLGFDLLSFTTLDKDSFIKTNSRNKFQRHHFRNDFFRKLSNYVQDLILTDGNNHRKYEDYSEAQMLVIMNGFDEMMTMEGTGRDKDGNPMISKQDVIKIFTETFPGNEWVLYGPKGKDGLRTGGENKDQGWFFSKEGFDGMLRVFNDRKNKLINEGLDRFLIDEYGTVYERFYLNFPRSTDINIGDADGFYSLVVPHPWLGDFAMTMNMEAWFKYPEY